MTQCQCIKGDGYRCSYEAKKGSKYCGIHKTRKRSSKSYSPPLYEYEDDRNSGYVHTTPIPFIYRITTSQYRGKKYLEYLQTITKKITDNDILEIIKILKLNLDIKSLDISNGSVSDRAFQELINTIQLTDIKELTFAHMGIDNTKAAMISDLTKVKKLYLSSNNIGNDGAVELAGNKYFRDVSLKDNKIGDKGAEAFAKNNKITYLTLGNRVNDKGIKALAGNTTLETLEVDGIFTAQAAKSFLQNKTLRNLDLYSKNYSYGYFYNITEHIKKQRYKKEEALKRGKEKFQKEAQHRKWVKGFDVGEKWGKPGSMQWAYMMGEAMQSFPMDLKRIAGNCMDARWEDTQGQLHVYTKDQLYYMAKGMDLDVTRNMKKQEICNIIARYARSSA